MINLELTREQAISLLLLIDREQDVYSTDHTGVAMRRRTEEEKNTIGF